MAIRRRKKTTPQKNHYREMSDKRRESTETTVEEEADRTNNLPTSRLSRKFVLIGVVLLILILAAGISLSAVFVGKDDASNTAPASSTDDNKNTRNPISSPGRTTDDASDTTSSQTSYSYTQRGTYRIHAQYPHDPKAFCQGLEVKNDTHVYESVGNYGVSAIRIVQITTGQVTLETPMDGDLFGEGVTLVTPPSPNEKDDNESSLSPFLIQLTWREQTAVMYHPETLVETGRFLYETTNTQGWGIAYNVHQPGKQNLVYVTDGTQFVHTWVLEQDDELGDWSYRELSKVPVTFHLEGRSEEPVTLNRINELEYDAYTGTLLANVWFQDVLIRIDVQSGFVTKVYDFSKLYKDRAPGSDVFNGIAAIPNRPGHYYVTGKWWPVLYHIELIE
jgi:glutamine cyclotransferase